MPDKRKVLVIVGSTATGKSQLAMLLAKKFNGEIINADALQVYREFLITTARPSLDDEAFVKHHLYGTVSISDDFDLKKYQSAARCCIDEISRRDTLPMLVGGSGLYVKAAIDDLDLPEYGKDLTLREALTSKFEKEGLVSLVHELRKLDPEALDIIDIKNPRRVIRALELTLLTGSKYSSLKHDLGPLKSRYNTLLIGIKVPAESLYDKISSRLKQQLKAGLLDEVRDALSLTGAIETLPALQAIGVKEFLPFLNGHSSLEECFDLALKNTKALIKRQGTWFRKDKRIIWFEYDGTDTRSLYEIIEPTIKDWLNK